MTEQDWLDLERTGWLLHAQEWTFAKTMAENPHHYTLRKKWLFDQDFITTVETIRRLGYRAKFGKHYYTQLDVNDHFYWTMGWPIGSLARPGSSTILINRKPLLLMPEYRVPYDAIAARGYDGLFTDPASLSENERVFHAIGDLAGRDILDVGCGTGLALDYLPDPGSYLGIDPSLLMLERLKQRHPHASTLCTTLQAFVAPPVELVDGAVLQPARYDAVLALFGVGSYLNDDELGRIAVLLRPGGRAAVMFYAPDYIPATYLATGITVPHRAWEPDLFVPAPGTLMEFRIGNHVLCLYDKP